MTDIHSLFRANIVSEKMIERLPYGIKEVAIMVSRDHKSSGYCVALEDIANREASLSQEDVMYIVCYLKERLSAKKIKAKAHFPHPRYTKFFNIYRAKFVASVRQGSI